MYSDVQILNLGQQLLFYGGSMAVGLKGIKLINAPNREWLKLFHARKLCVKFKDKEFYPKVMHEQTTTYGKLLRLKLPVGLTSEDVIKSQVAINEMLSARTGIYFDKGYTYIKIYISNLETEYAFEQVELKGLKLLFGHTMNGIKSVDLASNEPHCLVGGETGSGKSTLARGIITNLILNNDVKNIELHMIDLKGGVELSLFKDCAMVKSFAKDFGGAADTLNKVLSETKRRYEMFEQYECVDINEYNKLGNCKLKRWLLIIDEFAELAIEQSNIDIVCRIAAISRAAGIHLLLSTQRPDAKILDGRIKCNVTLVAGLKTVNGTNSRIIMDESGLESLRGNGHGLLKTSGDTIEFQAMNITTTETKELIKTFKIKKPKEVIEKDVFEIFDEIN